MKDHNKKTALKELTPELLPEQTPADETPTLKFIGGSMSVYISDTRIRILSVRKNGIEKWAETVIPPGLVSGGQINDPQTTGGILAALMAEHGFKYDRVTAGMSGLHSIARTIRLPAAARKVLGEAVRHEAEHGLPVKPDSVYLYWRLIREIDKELELFVIAYEKKVIDAMISTLRQAKFVSYVLELVPIALARTAGRGTLAMFDVRPGEFDIIGIKDNFPEVIRTLPLPGDVSPADNMPVIEEELSRTMRYFYAGPDGEDGKKVLGSGIRNNGHDVFAFLSSSLGMPVKPLSLPGEFPETFSPADYIVNLGLLLRSEDNRQGLNLPRINLLPERTKKKANRLPYAALISAAGLAAGIYMIMVNQSAAADLRQQIDYAKGTLTSSVATQQALLKLDNQVTTLSAIPAALDGIKNSFITGNRLVYDDMQAAFNLRPAGLNVTNYAYQDGLALQGTAGTQESVLAYARALINSGRFSRMTISGLQHNGVGTGYYFSLIMAH